MLDVFFCYIVGREGLAERLEITQKCYLKWYSMLDRPPRKLSQHDMDGAIDIKEFQRWRRMQADENANGKIYIVVDNDCLITDGFDLDGCLLIMAAHPEFSVISLMPSNAHISEWTPEDYETKSTSDVMEVESVGGIRFCRKGHLAEWPPMGEGPGYDSIHADAIRKTGKRVGYFRNHTMLHLGEGQSTIWPAHMVNA